jgi:hypothetical protein
MRLEVAELLGVLHLDAFARGPGWQVGRKRPRESASGPAEWRAIGRNVGPFGVDNLGVTCALPQRGALPHSYHEVSFEQDGIRPRAARIAGGDSRVDD